MPPQSPSSDATPMNVSQRANKTISTSHKNEGGKGNLQVDISVVVNYRALQRATKLSRDDSRSQDRIRYDLGSG